jgi:hypothetical protein
VAGAFDQHEARVDAAPYQGTRVALRPAPETYSCQCPSSRGYRATRAASLHGDRLLRRAGCRGKPGSANVDFPQEVAFDLHTAHRLSPQS